MFTKILCPIDFSPGSDHALAVASRIAKDTRAELVIVHVGSTPWLVPSRYPFPADLIEKLTREREDGLATAAREATRLGAPSVATRLVQGTAWDEIVHVLDDDTRFDLAVIGTHGRTGIARVLLGSVAEKVVRHAPCSVLAARARGDVKAFEHVLCPTDFSDSSRRAVELAAALVVPGGSGITLLHTIEMPVVYATPTIPPVVFAEVDKQTRPLIEQWAGELRSKVGVPVATLVETGSPGANALEILDKDPSYDLVVVGSHGRTGLKRVLLGSVAEKIVRHAPCPVLVARTR